MEIGAPAQLGAHRIDIWCWRLDSDQDRIATWFGLLNPEEQARANAFVNPVHGARFTQARARLREILAGYVERDPRDLHFTPGAFGKPELSLAHAPKFSHSRSEDCAIVAISDSAIVGADVERVRLLNALDLARRFFSAGECAALEALAPEEVLDGFFRCWTLKEAFVKAVGEGLSMPLDSFEMDMRRDGTSALRRWEGGQTAPWRMLHFAPAAGYVGALAVRAEGRACELSVRTLS